MATGAWTPSKISFLIKAFLSILFGMKLFVPLFLACCLLGARARAADFTFQSAELKEPRLLLAQADGGGGDEAYDPFSDYSEFDEASDEEADINFFRNGRFFVLSFEGGIRGFTDNLAQLYGYAPTYGLNIVYFFDLRFALQLGVLTGDHAYNFTPPSGIKNAGNVSMTFIDLLLKYYMNTQNVTRGLADLNPYLIGGFSQVYRTITFTDIGGSSRDATVGLDVGVGIEIPLMRKKAFFGIQAMYRYFTFPDSNQYLLDQSQFPPIATNTKPTGQSYDMTGIIGLNF